jgi:Domain of unknown function (DUF4397)
MRKQGLRTAWSWLVATILLGLWLLAAVPAAAGAQSGQAMVRVVHLSAGAPRVDLDVDGTRMLSAVPFRTASRYARVPAGTHTLVVRSGGSASSTTASAHASVQAGAAYTAFLLGSPTQLQVQVAKDDFSAPPPGKAKLRIVNAARSRPRWTSASSAGRSCSGTWASARSPAS